MWKIIKSEIEYSWQYLVVLGLSFFWFTILTLVNFQLILSPGVNIDFWGIIYNMILFAFIITIWGTRIKEKRNRYFSLLPIPQKKLSISRFVFSVLPFITILFYLIIVHLIFISTWHSETGSQIAQVGVTLIFFAGYIRARDDWFSYWNFGKRTQAAFVTFFIIQIIVVFIVIGLVFEMEGFNQNMIKTYGDDFKHYAKVIFFLLGFGILITTINSFKKRRTYLT